MGKAPEPFLSHNLHIYRFIGKGVADGIYSVNCTDFPEYETDICADILDFAVLEVTK